MWHAAALPLLLGATLTLPAHAQSTVAVIPAQGLGFGILTSGMETVVSPHDTKRRAVVDIVGSGTVSVSFVLPAGLTTGSTLLPVVFGPADGRVNVAGAGGEIVFDPNAGVSFSIPTGSTGASVLLGGTAQPGPRQPPGVYSAAVTVRVVIANSST